jgi:hypothetical protein
MLRNTKMRNLAGLFTLASVLYITGCHQDDADVTPQSGKVTFSFGPKSINSGGGRLTDQGIPTFASYTLKRADGSNLTEKIELFEFNGDFISSPQQLETGDYTLEQFLVLNAANQTIYASPLLGSELADLVDHPLPLPFEVAVDEVTNLVPEVLGLADHTPEEFGYVKFGFNLVQVTALTVPALPETEELEKVSYKFLNDTDIVIGEVFPDEVISIPSLLGGVWHATIELWTTRECSEQQKLYRFTDDLTFNGSVTILPEINQRNWNSLYHRTVGGISIFHSTDPRNEYHFEIHFPQNIAGRGYIDRSFWDLDEDQLCSTQYMELHGTIGSIGRADFPALICGDESQWRYLDSFLSITLNDVNNTTIQSYFSWDIEHGTIKPSACTPL